MSAHTRAVHCWRGITALPAAPYLSRSCVHDNMSSCVPHPWSHVNWVVALVRCTVQRTRVTCDSAAVFVRASHILLPLPSPSSSSDCICHTRVRLQVIQFALLTPWHAKSPAQVESVAPSPTKNRECRECGSTGSFRNTCLSITRINMICLHPHMQHDRVGCMHFQPPAPPHFALNLRLRRSDVYARGTRLPPACHCKSCNGLLFDLPPLALALPLPFPLPYYPLPVPLGRMLHPALCCRHLPGRPRGE